MFRCRVIKRLKALQMFACNFFDARDRMMNGSMSKVSGSPVWLAKYMPAIQVVCSSFSDGQLSAMVRKTPQ